MNRVTTSLRAFGPLALCLFAACAARAQLIASPSDGAKMTKAGGLTVERAEVIIEVRPNAWAGVPARLTKVTPLLVTIENKRSERIRLRYNEFVLKGAKEQIFHALPPFDIKAVQSERSAYAFPTRGFIIAPYQARFFPRFQTFRGPFAFDTIYFQSFHTGLQRHRLPTGDMVVKALPEGVLEPQGKITGFLYFENVARELETVDFVAKIVSADSGEAITEFQLPFQVD